MTLGELWADLGDEEPVRSLVYKRAGVWCGMPRSSWVEVARWASTLAGGLWFPGMEGVTWVCGRSVERCMSPLYYDLVEDCRGIVGSLGGVPADSVGGNARSLLALLGEPQYPYKGLFNAYAGRLFGYHDCTPGRWEQGLKWDVSGCYYQLLTKLPTVRCHLGRDGLRWHAWRRGEEDAWRSILAGVAPNKPLRNTLWGCMLGGTRPIAAYHKGEVLYKRGKLGPFRPAALAIGRAAYELCRQASHDTGSVLSNTDSVVSIDGSVPSIYEEVGLPLRVAAEGETVVYSACSFKVGPDASSYYTRGSTFRQEIQRECLEPGLCGWRWLLAG